MLPAQPRRQRLHQHRPQRIGDQHRAAPAWRQQAVGGHVRRQFVEGGQGQRHRGDQQQRLPGNRVPARRRRGTRGRVGSGVPTRRGIAQQRAAQQQCAYHSHGGQQRTGLQCESRAVGARRQHRANHRADQQRRDAAAGQTQRAGAVVAAPWPLHHAQQGVLRHVADGVGDAEQQAEHQHVAQPQRRRQQRRGEHQQQRQRRRAQAEPLQVPATGHLAQSPAQVPAGDKTNRCADQQAQRQHQPGGGRAQFGVFGQRIDQQQFAGVPQQALAEMRAGIRRQRFVRQRGQWRRGGGRRPVHLTPYSGAMRQH